MPYQATPYQFPLIRATRELREAISGAPDMRLKALRLQAYEEEQQEKKDLSVYLSENSDMDPDLARFNFYKIRITK